MHADCDAQDLADVANLICQLILRYKEALRGLLTGAVPVFVAAVHVLLPADWDWSGRTGQPQTAASGAFIDFGVWVLLADWRSRVVVPQSGQVGKPKTIGVAGLLTSPVLAQWQSADPNVPGQPLLRLTRQSQTARGLFLCSMGSSAYALLGDTFGLAHGLW